MPLPLHLTKQAVRDAALKALDAGTLQLQTDVTGERRYAKCCAIGGAPSVAINASFRT